eukprot:3061643-Rhodomonas_salina.4
MVLPGRLKSMIFLCARQQLLEVSFAGGQRALCAMRGTDVARQGGRFCERTTCSGGSSLRRSLVTSPACLSVDRIKHKQPALECWVVSRVSIRGAMPETWYLTQRMCGPGRVGYQCSNYFLFLERRKRAYGGR